MYKKMHKELEIFLKHYQISCTVTDVFEDTLLHLAGITTKHTGCSFGRDNDEKMYIKIRDITENDAEKFLFFLKTYSNDAHAKKKYVYACINDPELWPLYWFKVNTSCVAEHLLPVFKEEFARLVQENPLAYQHYQAQTLRHNLNGRLREWSEIQDELHVQTVNNSSLSETKLGFFKATESNKTPVDHQHEEEFSSQILFK